MNDPAGGSVAEQGESGRCLILAASTVVDRLRLHPEQLHPKGVGPREQVLADSLDILLGEPVRVVEQRSQVQLRDLTVPAPGGPLLEALEV